jgi:DNA replication and repair protein RecF
VRIRELHLRPYRNFTQIQLHFLADHVLIFGCNGRGKSNILEAISYLSIGKSVRGSQDQEAVPHEGEYFDIQALCEDGRQVKKLRVFYARTGGKKAFVDEAPLPRIADLIGRFKTVHFSPEDVSLVLRFPAQRRRLLDILISQSSPQYLSDLQRYQRVIAQRNHLLRANKRTPARATTEIALEPWTQQLVKVGARLRAKRLEVLDEIMVPFAQYHGRFALGKEKVEIEYRGSRQREETALEKELEQELKEQQEQELHQGFTLGGPHRDDLVFLIEGQPADSFASEGQLKTILISWKMAEVRFLEQPGSNQPALLLDDVFSELDRHRVDEMLGIIDEFEQVVVTTPQELEPRIRKRFGEIQLA